MKKILIAVDCQVDFLTNALANPEAAARIPNIVEKIKNFRETAPEGSFIIFTKDTHFADYMETLEGKKLPVPHCIEGTSGHELDPQIEALRQPEDIVFLKFTFGALDLAESLQNQYGLHYNEYEIELVGFCTDICVISNALLLRAALPDIKITIDASCCAGVTKEKHLAALEVAESCQIDVINK